MGDDAALDARARQMEAMAREGRYPSGSYLPALSRGFAAFERGDFSTAIDALAPLAGQNERIGGSRAQHDLIEFTLLKAYLDAGRLEEAQHLLRTRRPGASGVPVVGLPAVPLSGNVPRRQRHRPGRLPAQVGRRTPITARIGGYFRIEAERLADVEALLAGNPVYENGGTVEIRELPKTP